MIRRQVRRGKEEEMRRNEKEKRRMKKTQVMWRTYLNSFIEINLSSVGCLLKFWQFKMSENALMSLVAF